MRIPTIDEAVAGLEHAPLAPAPAPAATPKTGGRFLDAIFQRAADEKASRDARGEVTPELPAPKPRKPAGRKAPVPAPRVQVLPPATPKPEGWGIIEQYDAADTLAGLGVTVALDMKLQVIPNLANHVAVLREHPRFAGRFWYDSFHQTIRTGWDGEPRGWVDSDRLRLAAVLQAEHGLVKFSDDLVEKAVITIAQEDVRDELVDWLRSLAWDGTPRLDGWLPCVVGASADAYHQAVGRNFLLSMVARALRPGCKADCMPVFEGAQGSNKSTMLSVIGGPYFAELTESLDTKDFFIVLQSKWLVEVAELDAFRRSDVTRIKQLLTSQKDRCRLPYTRHAVDMPRRVIFAGSTNETAYLRDSTGARRFWPVQVAAIDLGWLRENRDQLFAEAVALFDQGATWWEVPQDAAREQAELRREVDAWETRIADHCVGRATVDVSAVLEALGVEIARQGKAEQMRVANALRLLGYQRTKKRFGSVARWVWVKPGAEDAEDDERPF